MAITYAVRLNASDLRGQPAAIPEVAEIIGKWAGINHPMVPGHQEGRRHSAVHTELLGSDLDAEWAWRLVLEHRDSQDPTVQWVVDAEVSTGETTDVEIRLDRRSSNSILMPRKDSPAPPACIRQLLDQPGVRFMDGPKELSTSAWVVGKEQAEELASLILSPSRQLPIFAMTGRDEDVIDGGRLLPKVAGLAHVVLIRVPTTWELGDLLPKGLNVYGGAARMWWPGIGPSADRWDHDLWTAENRAADIESEAASMIVEAGLGVPTRHPRVLKLVQKKREEEARVLAVDISDVRRGLTQAAIDLAPSDDQGRNTPAARDGALLEKESQTLELLQSELEEALDLAAREEEDKARFLERAVEAERERDRLRRKLGRLGVSIHQDPESERQGTSLLLRHIQDEIDERPEMDGALFRTFSLGQYFEDMVEQIGPAFRNKAVKACADIAIGAPKLLRRREDHCLRIDGGGDSPARVRDSDGAEAHRCSIERGAPSARRLHYWRKGDGSIEFASLTVHDDMSIPA